MLRRLFLWIIGLGFAGLAVSSGGSAVGPCALAPVVPQVTPPTLYFCSGYTPSNCVAQYVPTWCAGGGWDNLGNCALTNCTAVIPTLACSVQ